MLNKFVIVFTICGNFILGNVKDQNINEPLTGVCVISCSDTIYTNLNGDFKLKNEINNKKLVFNYVSYLSDTVIIK
jgi:hypothetical protein